VLIMRDQRRAIAALETAQAVPAGGAAQAPAAGASPAAGVAEPTAADVEPAPAGPRPTAGPADPAAAAHLASVERGRIASMAGVVSLIWLVILVLMIWNT